MNAIRQYFLCIAASALLYGLLSLLMSSGRTKRTLQFSGTLVLLISVMAPILKIQPEEIAKSFSKTIIAEEQMRTGLSLPGQEVQKAIISQRCSTYISDKLMELNMPMEISLKMREDCGVFYPYEIELRGSVDDQKKAILSVFLSADMGIPEERQVWLIE